MVRGEGHPPRLLTSPMRPTQALRPTQNVADTHALDLQEAKAANLSPDTGPRRRPSLCARGRLLGTPREAPWQVAAERQPGACGQTGLQLPAESPESPPEGTPSRWAGLKERADRGHRPRKVSVPAGTRADGRVQPGRSGGGGLAGRAR